MPYVKKVLKLVVNLFYDLSYAMFNTSNEMIMNIFTN
jgi:hypothetical protein